MANRAYLFFTDDKFALSKATQYRRTYQSGSYFDSRHQLPLAWLLFFAPESLVLESVTYMNSTWQEPYLARNWESARADFLLRVPLLLSWFEGEITREDVDVFWNEVTSRAATYLVCDPNELDYQDLEAPLRHALVTLDNSACGDAEKFAALNALASIWPEDDGDKRRDKVFGIWY